MKTKKPAAPAPPAPARELVRVASWEKALEALLSWQTTEKSISEAWRRHERNAVMLEAETAKARAGVVAELKAAGLPNPYTEADIEYDVKEKAVYQRRRPKA